LEEMKMDIASVISLPPSSGVSSGIIFGVEQTVEYFPVSFWFSKNNGVSFSPYLVEAKQWSIFSDYVWFGTNSRVSSGTMFSLAQTMEYLL
jgi:hypothetical protein